MWFHSLKTRQTIRRMNTRNSGGIAVSLEYSDKKTEVHHIKREANPLVFDEGSGVIFVVPKEGCIMLVAVNISGKGKSTYEFRTWDLTSSAAFLSRDITVQDIHKSVTNDGKTRALLSISEVSQHNYQHTIKADALDDVMAIAMDVSMVFIWKVTKMENGGLNCEIIGYVNSSMPAQDVLLLQVSKDLFPQLLVGESGGLRIWKKTDDPDCQPTSAFEDTFCPVASFDAGTNLVSCQEFQRINRGTCIFSNSIGNLYLFASSKVINLHLPISCGGHGLFAVENVDDNCTKVTLAVVYKGSTINLYHLEDILKFPNAHQDTPITPHHALFSAQSLGSISFLQKGSLATCSLSSRTLSMWVGV